MSPKGVYERPDRSISPHKKRVPVGTRNKLTAPEREGFVRRFVNDTDGRLPMFEDAGYTPVRVPTQVGDPAAGNASQVGSVVRKPVGGGVDAVLMEIPKEWYDEDQLAKEQRLKEKEQSLLKEAVAAGAEGEGIRIQRPRPEVTLE
jgi:hypothetical protein